MKIVVILLSLGLMGCGSNGSNGSNGIDGGSCTIDGDTLICPDGSTHIFSTVVSPSPNKCTEYLDTYSLGHKFNLEVAVEECGEPVRSKNHGHYTCNDTYEWKFDNYALYLYRVRINCDGIIDDLWSI
jgi:hypothetical protein